MMMAMPPVRVTQRAPQSCQLCSIKKMKCSKQIPCASCVSRGLQDQCRREAVIVHKRPPRASGEGGRGKRARGNPSCSLQEDSSAQLDDVENNGQQQQEQHQPLEQTAQEHLQQPIRSQGREYERPRQLAQFSYDQGHPYQPRERSRRDQMGGLAFLSEPNRALQCQSDVGEGRRIPSSPRQEACIEQEATISIESLAWFRQRAIHHEPERVAIDGPGLPTSPEAIVSADQVQPILAYHRHAVAWMHNVIHMPTFFDDYANLLETHTVPDQSWLSLYFAVLATGLYYMGKEQQQILGFHDADAMSKTLYQAALKALQESDYMTTQSVYALQAICVILLCANTFGDAKRMVALLSAATSIARDLGLHRLGPDPTGPQPVKSLVEREVAKRIWTFLTVQDWFLIPFKDAYSIHPDHTTTPIPHNCEDEEVSFAPDGMVCALDLNTLTQCTYTILNYKVAEVLRAFFDRSCPLSAANLSLSETNSLYEEILVADTAMETLWRSFPAWLRGGAVVPNRWVQHLSWQRRIFEISFNHKRLMVHRRFFLPSLKSKLYYYTHMTCLSSARTILNLYCSARRPNELWTVFAHVTAAAIVLGLSLLFDGATADRARDWQLVKACVAQLRDSELSSTISSRGVKIISYLLESGHCQSPSGASTSPHPSVGKLLKDLEGYMSGKGRTGGEEYSFDFDFSAFDDPLYDLLEGFPLGNEFVI